MWSLFSFTASASLPLFFNFSRFNFKKKGGESVFFPSLPPPFTTSPPPPFPYPGRGRPFRSVSVKTLHPPLPSLTFPSFPPLTRAGAGHLGSSLSHSTSPSPFPIYLAGAGHLGPSLSLLSTPPPSLILPGRGRPFRSVTVSFINPLPHPAFHLVGAGHLGPSLSLSTIPLPIDWCRPFRSVPIIHTFPPSLPSSQGGPIVTHHPHYSYHPLSLPP